MKFDKTGLESTIVQFSILDHIMHENGLVLAGQWDYERVTYDYKFEDMTNGDVYYLRVPGVAIEGMVESSYAVIKLGKPYLGKHYYPHGVEYDEEFPETILNTCYKKLEILRDQLGSALQRSMVSVGDLAQHVTPAKPSDSVAEAAAIMKKENVTIVPVCDGENLVGIVTDRAIAVGGFADNQAGTTKVEGLVEKPSMTLSPDMKPEQAAELMNESRLTEVIVLDGERFVGIVSYFQLKEKMNA
ncbi:YugN family protein [Guptibacillus hwajinpoensis]|uniref:YugN family protein n=1 Tax=Guptibacillus hwajinpoensis TaxID=208199 RepID=UPI003CD0DC05